MCPGALACHESDLPPQVQQMLLVLQSVHRSPPDDRFFILQDLVAQVVDSYLPMVPRTSKAFGSPPPGEHHIYECQCTTLPSHHP